MYSHVTMCAFHTQMAIIATDHFKGPDSTSMETNRKFEV